MMARRGSALYARRRGSALHARRILKSKSIWLALAAVTLLAAVLRYWQITALPPGYWYDEAHKSLVALEILRGIRHPIYVTDGQGLEAGYFWLLAGWFRLFGASYFGSRALSALLGALTIPITFWSVHILYRPHHSPSPSLHLFPAPSLPLLTAAILSFLLWHVHWSRLGLETITVPMFAIALLGLIAWAWQKQTWWAFALAGATLGLSQYTNPGARVLPLEALLVFLILAEWRTRDEFGICHSEARAVRRGISWLGMMFHPIIRYGLVFLIAVLLVYAPLGLFFLQNPEWFFNRIAFASENARAGGLLFILDNAIKTLLSFNFRGDVMVRHNLPLRPALDPLLSVWMWIGLAAMVLDFLRQRTHLALFAALVVNLLPMIFSDGAPGFGRTLGAVPMLAVLPALGMAAAWEWRSQLRSSAATAAPTILSSSRSVIARARSARSNLVFPALRLLRRLPPFASLMGTGRRLAMTGLRHAPILVGVSLIVSAGWNVYDYFVRYPRQPGLFDAFEVGLWTAAQAAERASETGAGYLILDEAGLQHPTVRLARELTKGDLRIVNGQACFAYPAETQSQTVFATLPQWIAPIQTQYPDSELTNILHEPEVYQYGAVLAVPAGRVSAAASGQAVGLFGGMMQLLAADFPDQVYAPGEAVPITLRWKTIAPPDQRYTTFIHLVGGGKPFVAGVDGEPCQSWYPTDRWHVGEIVEYQMSLSLPPDLPVGDYDLAVGVYDWISGERLPITSSLPSADKRLLAASLEVGAGP